MALFEHKILPNYIPLNCEHGFLNLHCSRMDKVTAPFKGKLQKNDDGCSIIKGEYILKINHIDLSDMHDGDIIGTPRVDRYEGRDIAYIGIALYKNGEPQNVILYLKGLDVDDKPVVVEPIEEPIEEKKETPKKTTSKKKVVEQEKEIKEEE